MKRLQRIGSLLAIVLVLSGPACLALDASRSSPVAPAASPVPAPVETPAARSVVLIGWDGAQRDHVKESLGRGELPSLKALSAEGAFVDIDIVGATDTKAGWSQILSGYNPEVTGVYDNGRYRPLPRGYSIFGRLKKHFGKDNFAAAAIIGGKPNIDDREPRRQPYKEGDQLLASAEIVADGNTKYQMDPGGVYRYTRESTDVFVNGLDADEEVGKRAMEALEKYRNKQFFLFIHFIQVDSNGHWYGENSVEYNDALISADAWTGRIVQKLKDLKLYDRTYVYVTADHGFDEGQRSHNNAPYVFLGTNDAGVVRNGLRSDIAPTILDRFGLDLSQIAPPLNGRSLLRP